MTANHEVRLFKIKRDPLVDKLWTGKQPQSMNEEQKESLKIAIKNKFQLIQGPPGNNMCLHKCFMLGIMHKL